MENDVNLAVLGENWMGQGQGIDNLAYIALGTGIGCGIMVDGHLVRGATNAAGDLVEDPGWSGNRSLWPEDIEATIYSAAGIDWTTVRHDDPFGRGFEYVPFSDQDLYGPIDELWA